MGSDKQLVVLSCSAKKRDDDGPLPALERYNGPLYKVLRSFLREAAWPSSLSVAVMSAEYGLIGGLAQIEDYDQRMTRDLSDKWRPGSTKTLQAWGQQHDSVSLVLGKDYLPALDRNLLEQRGINTKVVQGGIGTKLGCLRHLLHGMEHQARPAKPDVLPGRPL